MLFQASRDLAQINDLQSQLEDASKEKQGIQEKVLHQEGGSQLTR